MFFAKTHLGHLLSPGDTALGYDLTSTQLVGLDYEAFVAKGGSHADVILVRKSYEEKRKKRKAKVSGRAGAAVTESERGGGPHTYSWLIGSLL